MSLTRFHKEFVNLHHVPAAKSFIYQGHICIKCDNGKGVPFMTGKTMIKLQFRINAFPQGIYQLA